MKGKITAVVASVVAAAGAAGAAVWARTRKGDEPKLEVMTPPGAGASKDAGAAAATQAAPDTVAPPVSPDPASDPPSSGAAPVASSRAEAADDLTAIKGLGKVKAAKLAEAGITSYAQIAAWTDDDMAEVGLKVNTSPGQIKREDWVGQAKALLEG